MCALWGYDFAVIVYETGLQPLDCYHDTQTDSIQPTLGGTLLQGIGALFVTLTASLFSPAAIVSHYVSLDIVMQ